MGGADGRCVALESATRDINVQRFAQLLGAFAEVLAKIAIVNFPALENVSHWFSAMVETSTTSAFHPTVVYIRLPPLHRPIGAFG